MVKEDPYTCMLRRDTVGHQHEGRAATWTVHLQAGVVRDGQRQRRLVLLEDMYDWWGTQLHSLRQLGRHRLPVAALVWRQERADRCPGRLQWMDWQTISFNKRASLSTGEQTLIISAKMGSVNFFQWKSYERDTWPNTLTGFEVCWTWLVHISGASTLGIKNEFSTTCVVLLAL
jgi:hypothetical protein